LSGASNDITLTNSAAVEAVTNISLSSAGNTGTYEDIRISFDKVSNEKNVTGYRVFLVPTDKVEDFKVSFANKASSENYTAISLDKNTSNAFSLDLMNDVYGKKINTSTYYHAVVMTLTKLGDSYNVLSEPSPQFKLPAKKDDIPTEEVKSAPSDAQL